MDISGDNLDNYYTVSDIDLF